MRSKSSKILVIGIVVYFQALIFGQNWIQISSGTTKNLNSVEFANDYIGWAVGSSGTILKSTNGGSSWSSQTSGTTKSLNDLHVFSKDTVVVVGEDAVFLYTLNGGTTWIRSDPTNSGIKTLYTIDGSNDYINSPYSIATGGEYLTKVYTSNFNSWKDGSYGDLLGNLSASVIKGIEYWFQGSSNCFITVGSKGHIYRRLPGKQGHLVADYTDPDGNNELLLGVGRAGDSNTFVAVGNKVIGRSTDLGENWSFTQVNFQLYEVQFLNNSDGFIVGMGTTAGALAPVLKTTDGGATWTTDKLITTSYMMGIHMFDEETGVIVGTNGEIWKRLEETPPTITSVSSPNANGTYGNGDVINIAVTFSEPVYVSGDPELYLETGTNTAMTKDSYGSGTNTIHFMYTVESSHQTDDLEAKEIIIGNIRDAAGNAAVRSLPAAGATGSLSANKDIVIDGSLTLQRGVSTWVKQSLGTTKDFRAIDFVSSDIGWVVGQSSTIYKTLDGGISWQNQTTNSTNSMLTDVDFIDSNTGFITTNSSKIMKTTDGGASFGNVNNGGGGDWFSVDFIDLNTGWVVGQNGTILKTTDGGSNWSSQTIGSKAFLSVFFINNTTGWAVGDGGTIVKTVDAGTNWSSQTSGTSENLYSVYFIDANIGWASGDNGRVLRTINGGSNWYGDSNENTGTSKTFMDVHFIDNNTGYAASSIILKSIDGGLGWSELTGISDNLFWDIHLINSSLGYMVGTQGTMYKLSDTTGPTVTSVSSTAKDSTYGIGSVIPITVTFDESVIVKGINDSININIKIGSSNIKPIYNFGSGSNSLTFNYTVEDGHFSKDLSYLNTTAFYIGQGVTILDGAGNAANLTLPTPGSTGSLSANKNIIIDSVLGAPIITNISLAADNSAIEVTFSEPIYSTADGSGVIEASDFTLLASRNTDGAESTSAVLSSNTPISLAKNSNIFTLGISFSTPAKVLGDTLYVRFADNSIYDSVGNEAEDKIGTQVGVSYFAILNDLVPPVISLVAPQSNSYLKTIDVSYSIDEAAASGSVIWTNTGGSTDNLSPHQQALTGDELNKGPHTNILLTNTPTLADGGIYTLRFDVADESDNNAETVLVTDVTYDFSAPKLINVTPANDSFLPIESSSTIRMNFSEPITDYKLDISSKLGTNLNTSIKQASDSLVVTLNAPLTSLDSIKIKVTDIKDRVGLVSEPIEVSYQTSILADYNNDYKVDVQDLASFVSLWPNIELGPVKGTIPYLTPDMDGTANLRDIGVFTRMWRWSYANNGALGKVYLPMGEPIVINHGTNKISISIPDHAVAGEIVIEYLESEIDLGLSDEMTESRLVISNRDQEQGKLSINFGYLKDMQNKELELRFKNKSISSSNFIVSYIYYDNNNTLVNSGSQDFDIKAIPLAYALHENYPNPFNPSTTLRFDLPNVSNATLTIYNMLGQKVKTFNMQNKPAGFHSLKWNATNDYGDPVGAGIYLYQLQTKDFVKTRKMVLLK